MGFVYTDRVIKDLTWNSVFRFHEATNLEMISRVVSGAFFLHFFSVISLICIISQTNFQAGVHGL